MTNNAITYRFNGSARKITTPIGVSMPNGNPLDFVAVWDTGATNSIITFDVASRLNLCPEGSIVINGVKTGKKKEAPYSFENDTLYDLRDYPDKYKIRTKKYNNQMFRVQRFYGGKYPELDKEIIKYIEKYLEKVENQ